MKAKTKDTIESLKGNMSGSISMFTPKKISRSIIGTKIKVRTHLTPIDRINEINEARTIVLTTSLLLHQSLFRFI